MNLRQYIGGGKTNPRTSQGVDISSNNTCIFPDSYEVKEIKKKREKPLLRFFLLFIFISLFFLTAIFLTL
jgi:hypothetical protein